MQIRRLEYGLLTLGFCLPFAVAWARPGSTMPEEPGQAENLLEIVGPGFQVKQTAHFLIAHNSDDKVVQRLTTRVEQTFHMISRFCDIHKLDIPPLKRRLEIVFFGTPREYHQFVATLGFPSVGTLGVYYAPINRSFFFNSANDGEIQRLRMAIIDARQQLAELSKSVDEMTDEHAMIEVRFGDGRRFSGDRIQVQKRLEHEIDDATRHLSELERQGNGYADYLNRSIIQHETAHQVFYQLGVHVPGPNNPRWLVEGLACLFETPPGPEGTSFVAVNQLRLKDFRSAVAGETEKRTLNWRDYMDALEAKRLPSARQMIMNWELLDARGVEGSNNYAVTWALMNFLYRIHGRQLAAYLQDTMKRDPDNVFTKDQELEVFEKHFGTVDETFERRFGGYTLQIPYRDVMKTF